MGWEVIAEPHTGSGYIDICIVSRRRRTAALIEIKSSKNLESLERDAEKALEQIIPKTIEINITWKALTISENMAWPISTCNQL
jgi:hypothetical protein